MDLFLSRFYNVTVISRVFNHDNISKLTGYYGLGHVRYPTAGSPDRNEAQPFYTNYPYQLALSLMIDMAFPLHITET